MVADGLVSRPMGPAGMLEEPLNHAAQLDFDSEIHAEDDVVICHESLLPYS